MSEKILEREKMNFQDFNFLRGKTWVTLEEVYISNNLLSSIDVFSNFRSIKIINASYNYI